MAQNNALNKSSEDFTVDNIFIDGNSIITTDTNGTLTVQPDGTGRVDLTTQRVRQYYSYVGNNVAIDCANTDTTNSSSNALVRIETAAATSGDPYLGLTITGITGYGFGIDNSDSDALLLTNSINFTAGSTLMKFTTAGECTKPLQPAFLATLNTQDDNVTGSGTIYTLGNTDIANTLTEVFDQGGDFTPGASGGAVFTAPVAGRYVFNCQVRIRGATASATQHYIKFESSNLDNFCNNCVIGALLVSPNGEWYFPATVMTDMDASDTMSLKVRVAGEASDVVDLSTTSFFAGWLEC